MTVTKHQTHVEIRCENALDFINKLRLTDPYWQDYSFGELGFRGQVNASWQLIPSAFRPNAMLNFLGNSRVSSDQFDVNLQCLDELICINEFLVLADSVGLSVPGDNPLFRDRETYRNRYIGNIAAKWPPTEVLETLAIAQHHGVPTRLIDFSYSPLIAAFFATYGEDHEATDISVWVVNMRYVNSRLNFRNLQTKGTTIKMPARVRTVTVPRSSNTFLHAQHGFFLLDQKANEPSSAMHIDEAFRSDTELWQTGQAKDWNDSFGAVQPVTKIVLSKSEVDDVRALLGKEGITQAHVFPSFDQVASSIRVKNRLE